MGNIGHEDLTSGRRGQSVKTNPYDEFHQTISTVARRNGETQIAGQRRRSNDFCFERIPPQSHYNNNPSRLTRWPGPSTQQSEGHLTVTPEVSAPHEPCIAENACKNIGRRSPCKHRGALIEPIAPNPDALMWPSGPTEPTGAGGITRMTVKGIPARAGVPAGNAYTHSLRARSEFNRCEKYAGP